MNKILKLLGILIGVEFLIPYGIVFNSNHGLMDNSLFITLVLISLGIAVYLSFHLIEKLKENFNLDSNFSFTLYILISLVLAANGLIVSVVSVIIIFMILFGFSGEFFRV